MNNNNFQKLIKSLLEENYPKELLHAMKDLFILERAPQTKEAIEKMEELINIVIASINTLIFKAICPLTVFFGLSQEQTATIAERHTNEIMKEIKAIGHINKLKGNH